MVSAPMGLIGAGSSASASAGAASAGASSAGASSAGTGTSGTSSSTTPSGGGGGAVMPFAVLGQAAADIIATRRAARALESNAASKADAILLRAKQRSEAIRRQTDRLAAEQRAGFAGAGFSAGSGTAQAVTGETFAETLLQTQRIIHGAEKTAAEIRTAAHRRARRAKRQAKTRLAVEGGKMAVAVAVAAAGNPALGMAIASQPVPEGIG